MKNTHYTLKDLFLHNTYSLKNTHGMLGNIATMKK